MEFVPLSDCELHLVETARTKQLGAAGRQWIVSTDVGDMIGIFEGTGEEDQKEYGEPDDTTQCGARPTSCGGGCLNLSPPLPVTNVVLDV